MYCLIYTDNLKGWGSFWNAERLQILPTACSVSRKRVGNTATLNVFRASSYPCPADSLFGKHCIYTLIPSMYQI